MSEAQRPAGASSRTTGPARGVASTPPAHGAADPRPASTAARRLAKVLGQSATPPADVGLACGTLAFAGVMWWQSRKIPPPFFDPLGSAAVPRAVALVLAVFAAVVLVRALLARPWPPRAGPGDYRQRPDIAVGIVALAVAYVGAMAAGLVGFALASVVFIAAGTALLSSFRWRTVAIGVALALVLGIGGTLVFTEFFYIDLPR